MSWPEVKKINSNLNKPLNELLAEGIGAKVKSIQFVTTSGTNSSSNIASSRTFTIAPVDRNKCIILGNGQTLVAQGYPIMSQYAVLTDNTTLTEYSSYYTSSTQYGTTTYRQFIGTRYTIIEFY